MAVTGGFLEVLDNRVTVLADAAEQADGDCAGARRRGNAPRRGAHRVTGV